MDGVLDLRKADVLELLKVQPQDLACPWKLIAFVQKAAPPTWDLANRLVEMDVAGILVPSFQPCKGSNVVIWSWNDRPERKVTALDPLGDLPKDGSSWGRDPTRS